MIIINKEKMNILKPVEGKLLKDKNDNGETLEDGTCVEPYKTDIVYLGVQIKTLEQAKELYEEVDIQ